MPKQPTPKSRETKSQVPKSRATKSPATKQAASKQSPAKRPATPSAPMLPPRPHHTGRVRPNAKMLALIHKLAAMGSRERGIYIAIGITDPTWQRLKREEPSVVEALHRGQEEFHNQLLADVVRMSKSNNVVAPLFLLKARYGYREGDEPQDSKPQVIINLPGSASPEQYLKTITVEHNEPVALPAPAKAKVSRG